MSRIRLSDEDVQAIIKAFKDTFGPENSLWIFGSRVDLSRRGGDIDLYVETQESEVSRATKREFDFKWRMWEAIGEQKIDIVLNILALQGDLPIYTVAKREGIKLV